MVLLTFGIICWPDINRTLEAGFATTRVLAQVELDILLKWPPVYFLWTILNLLPVVAFVYNFGRSILLDLINLLLARTIPRTFLGAIIKVGLASIAWLGCLSPYCWARSRPGSR